MKGYKLEREELVQALKRMKGITTVEIRKALKAHKVAFAAMVRGKEVFKDLKITFKPEIWASHPITGSPAVRIRQQYTGGRDMTPIKPEPSTGKAGQKAKGSPKELDPFLLEKFLKGDPFDSSKVKEGFKLTLKDEEPVKIDFSKVESVRTRDALEMLEFKMGFDRVSNSKVLYTPLAFNNRWDRMAKAFWYRSIGMYPNQIASILKVKPNTLKTWLKNLTKYPLVSCRKTDWATGVDQYGKIRYFSQASGVDAVKHTFEPIAEYTEDEAQLIAFRQQHKGE